VLGLTAERIARAYAEPAAALAQRLVRAKRKIRHSGIPFEEPQPEDLSARLTDVLEAVYAAFGQSWEDAEAGLSVEALYLGDLIAKALPESAEAKGLLSLMCHVEARRPARRDARGQFVPLDLQDSALWSRPLLLRAEGLLHGAARLGQTGRFQVEAAIQSVHAGRAFGAEVSLEGLLALHDKLLAIAPSLGASVSRASVLLRLGHLDEARRALEHLEGVECYQPYWVLRAELGDAGAPEKALALTEDGAVRAYLADRFRVLAT
jgi:RNA polymerase sigma-70 factor (ECF subfamily)